MALKSPMWSEYNWGDEYEVPCSLHTGSSVNSIPKDNGHCWHCWCIANEICIAFSLVMLLLLALTSVASPTPRKIMVYFYGNLLIYSSGNLLDHKAVALARALGEANSSCRPYAWLFTNYDITGATVPRRYWWKCMVWVYLISYSV